MKYIGNYKDWIDANQPIINKMLGTVTGERNGTYHDTEIVQMQGDRRPKPPTEADLYKETLDLATLWKGAGYELHRVSWEMFYESHLGKFEPPFPITTRYEHWFCKMSPGDLLPMHDDRFEGKTLNDLLKEGSTVKRYWMACQDAMLGHVFSYKTTNLTDYKAGDLFLFDEADALHGSCNIGFIPKISYQLTVIETNFDRNLLK
jgi:hypothetical protein